MTVLVTGGTGFVGSHLLASLVARGTAVRALVRSPAKAAELGLEGGGVQWVAGDLSDSARLAEVTRDVSHIYHLAALTSARSETDYLAVNREGTARLLDAAARSAGETAGPRFIMVSSLAAAGPSTPGQPLTDPAVTAPVTAYGRSKAAAERVVREGPLPWTILRPGAVYGPRDREMLRIFSLARYGVAPVFGGGGQQLSLVYGPDLAEALVAAADSEAAVRQSYFVTHPEVLTAREVVRTIGEAMGREVRVLPIPALLARGILQVTGLVAGLAGQVTLLNPDKGNEFLAPAWTCRPDALERDTGWRARHDLAAGASLTRDWYRTKGWLPA